MKNTRILLFTFALSFFLLGSSSGSWAKSDPSEDLWYVVMLDGQRAGYSHALRKTDGDEIISSQETVLEIGRGSAVIRVEMRGGFTETKDGKPVSAWSESSMSPRTEWIFAPDSTVTQRTIVGDTVNETTLELPDVLWRTPAAAGRFVAQQLKSGSKTITYSVLDPTVGPTPVTATHEVLETTTVEVMGKTVPAIRCRTSNSFMPNMKTVDFLDPETGDVLRTVMNFGALSFEILAADKSLAMSPVEPRELMAETLVEPDQLISKPRKTRKAEYILTLKGENEMPDLVSAGSQTVKRIDEKSLQINVDIDHPLPVDDVDRVKALEASSFLNSNDPLIKKLVDDAIKGIPDDPVKRAAAIRQYVYNYISGKNLGVGFASASETARTREGDCSEHSVLMAAMLRAENIPSRLASGLIYADQFLDKKGIFGYHMWTQALLPDENGKLHWVDFDPTWPNKFDATHILLQTSYMSDDGLSANDMVTLAPLIGKLQIKVIQAE